MPESLPLAAWHAHDCAAHLDYEQPCTCCLPDMPKSTEPERTRAAVVKALREVADLRRGPHLGVEHVPAQWISERADAIENGADW